MISKETAIDIAMAYREIEAAKELLAKITAKFSRHDLPDIRDAFGRQQGGLQLGVPSGPSSHTCYNVPWSLAKVVLEAHIAAQEQVLAAMNAKAAIECDAAAMAMVGLKAEGV